MYGMNSKSKVDLNQAEALSAGKTAGMRKKRSASSSSQDSVSGAFQNLLQSLVSDQRSQTAGADSGGIKSSASASKDRGSVSSLKKTDNASSAAKAKEKVAVDKTDSRDSQGKLSSQGAAAVKEDAKTAGESGQKNESVRNSAGKTEAGTGISEEKSKDASSALSENGQEIENAGDGLPFNSLEDARAILTEKPGTSESASEDSASISQIISDTDAKTLTESSVVNSKEVESDTLWNEASDQMTAENLTPDQKVPAETTAEAGISEGKPGETSSLSEKGPEIENAGDGLSFNSLKDAGEVLSTEESGTEAFGLEKAGSEAEKVLASESNSDLKDQSGSGDPSDSNREAGTSVLERSMESHAETPSALSENAGKDENNLRPEHANVSDADRISAGQVINPGQNAEITKNTGMAEPAVQGQLTTSPARLPEDLSDFIARNWRNQSNQPGTMEVTLNPESLGKITIHLTYESGRASLSIMATRPETFRLLSGHVDQMSEILTRTTGRETSVVLPPEMNEGGERTSMNLESRSQNRREADEGQNHQEQRQRQSRNDRFINMMRLGLD